MTHSIEYSVHRIREFRKSEGYTKNRLAVLAGIAEGSVRSIDSKGWNPTLETIKKIDSLIPESFAPIFIKTKPRTKRNSNSAQAET